MRRGPSAFAKGYGGTSLWSAIIGVALVIAGVPGEAHKPITSPYNYNEHVFPILKNRCGGCHVEGGVAPMSLMTHADAVPWGESIRSEVTAGHMPPWPVDMPHDGFRNGSPMTARELNVLLTWATGGTPPGEPDKAPAPVTLASNWSLGKPDLELPLMPVTLAAGQQEQTRSFVIATDTREPRWIRAVDLLPGTPAMVRSADIRVVSTAASTSAGGIVTDRRLALWLPGETPTPLDAGAGFELPAGAQLAVMVRYKKTWQYERKELMDRSRVGLYFADGPAKPLNALTIDLEAPVSSATGAPTVTGTVKTLERDVRALAIYPEALPRGARVRVEAVLPDGSQEMLISARAQPDWLRRYWFKKPIVLPRGTRLNAHVSRDEEADLEPASPPSTAAKTSEPTRPRVILNVIE
jgi:hypothetical protein